MYEAQTSMANPPCKLNDRIHDRIKGSLPLSPTVRDSIDQKIAYHQDEIERLNETRAELEKANLLDMKISDLREAMNY
jgi:uncharacterized small protein (DUF1192 family)